MVTKLVTVLTPVTRRRRRRTCQGVIKQLLQYAQTRHGMKKEPWAKPTCKNEIQREVTQAATNTSLHRVLHKLPWDAGTHLYYTHLLPTGCCW